MAVANNITQVSGYAFASNTLTKITFGENSQLTTIGVYAFTAAYQLSSINIPDSVVSIGEGAFLDSVVSEITFGENSQLSVIGDKAFAVTGVSSLILSSTVTNIGEDAFSWGSYLSEITYKGTRAQWNAINFNSAWNSSNTITKVICSDGIINL